MEEKQVRDGREKEGKFLNELDNLLSVMYKIGASDLHLKPMRPPLVRVNGDISELSDYKVLKPEDIERMVLKILRPHQKRKLEERLSVDIGYGVRGIARFRGNIYVQRGTLAASFRIIPYKVQSMEELELPDTLLDFCSLPMGLVLVTGPTGSGKSTTLAVLINYIARTRPVHIITIEDPIEFLFHDNKATIAQREVGTDTISFAEALRNAMRQDPDVIMVGEMRDLETIATTITAAETGHLVFSTLHTNSAAQTIDRILDAFPPQQQKQVRSQLAQILKGVVSMKLVTRKGGKGRVPAMEIMKTSPRIAELIEKGNIADIPEEIEKSVEYYRMQTMNQSLLALLVYGTISIDEAMRQSPDPEDLSLKMRKMFPRLEQKGGEEMPSTADFSEILKLQEYRKLYEEQEEKHNLQLMEKDQEISMLKQEIASKEQEIVQLKKRMEDMKKEMEKMRGDFKRLREEAQQRIDKLMARIRELNRKLEGGDRKSGLFG